jgi:hypothetical protein
MKTAPTTKQLQYLTGEEALAEITTNPVYADTTSSNYYMNGNANGDYVAPLDWDSYGYKYTTRTATKTAVYSVTVNAPNGYDGAGGCRTACAGITVTNGTLIEDRTYVDGSGTTRTLKGDAYYGTCFALAGDRNYVKLSGPYMRQASMASFNATNLLATNKTVTLTLVLYNDTFYFYINGTFREAISVNEDAQFQAAKEQPSGNQYGYDAGDSFIFGVASYNVAKTTPVTFSNVVEKYDDVALAEITTNPVYANIGAQA